MVHKVGFVWRPILEENEKAAKGVAREGVDGLMDFCIVVEDKVEAGVDGSSIWYSVDEVSN